MVGAAAAQIVLLYQTSIIKHLPDPPLSIFDSRKVDASTYAYKRLNQPDGPPMITYSLPAALAATVGKERGRETPLVPTAISVKVLIDAATALELAHEEWQENHKLCA